MNHSIRFAFIVNPRSAHGRTGARWPEMRRAIEAELGPVSAVLTDGQGHASELVREALRDGFDRIVSVGGDGTHHEVLNGFFEGATPVNPEAVMALLPHGTGSDLARTLRIPRKPSHFRYLAGERIVRADVGLLTSTYPGGVTARRYFQNTCRIGIGGEVAERVNSNTKAYGGFITFLWATLRALMVYRDQPLRIQCGDREIEQLVKELVVAKGRYDGGGMLVAPYAELDNGLFDVYVIGKIGVIDAVFSLHKIYRGRLTDRPDVVKYLRAGGLRIASPQAVKIQADGESLGTTPATIEVVPGAIRVLIG